MATYNVLFIDDDEFIRKIYSDRLTASGIDLATASNGKEAIDLMTNNEYDLICTDSVMPDKTGKEVIEWIRNEKKSTVPILVFSASGQDAQMKEMMDAGATEYVQKDHTVPTALVEKIKTIVDTHR